MPGTRERRRCPAVTTRWSPRRRRSSASVTRPSGSRVRLRRSVRSTFSPEARTSSLHACGSAWTRGHPTPSASTCWSARSGSSRATAWSRRSSRDRSREALRDAVSARGLPVVELPVGGGPRRRHSRDRRCRRGNALRAEPQRRRQPLAGRALGRRRRPPRRRRSRRRARASHLSLNEMSWAPSQSMRRPRSRRFSLPETMVAKWFPASAPALLANAT